MVAEPQTDGTRSARETDHIRLNWRVTALAFTLRNVEARVAALEAAVADAREDLIAGREIDAELGDAIDAMLSDVAAGHR